MKKKVQKTLDKFKLLYKPDTYVRDVSMEDRHLLYTALVVDLYKSDVVLLDEVTSALPRTKTKILFEYLNEVKKTKSIVLITHRIQEIIEICDYVTVFRDGKKITTEKTSNLDEYQLANMIVGEKVVVPSFAPEFYLSSGGKKEENVRVQSLSNKSFFQDISFINYKGEILGITGLLESGSSNLLRTISGVEPYDHGDIFFEGIPFHPESPTNSVKNGIIYGTNDRIHEGTFGNMSILDNLNEIVWENLLKGGVFDEKQQMENYNHYKEIYNIKADSPNDNILTLSGGNQQKILLSRLSLPNPKILVLDEPTKGIDVGAKYEILRILREKLIGTERSRSIIVNSSSISELMIICDRIIVMFAGGIRDTFERESFDENTIFRSIQGVK
jgi:ribose transport system ATP-binding protein